MTAEEILNALAHPAFCSLHNLGDGWAIRYEFMHEEEGTMRNATLDSLLSDWAAKIQEAETEPVVNNPEA